MLTGIAPKLMKFAMMLPNALRKMPFDLVGLAHITANAVAIVLAILIGAAVVLPAIIGYTVFAYRVFWGKARELSYGAPH